MKRRARSSLPRRAFLRGGGALAGAVAAGCGTEALPAGELCDDGALEPVTDNDDFYITSFIIAERPTQAEADAWALTLGGLTVDGEAGQEREVALADLVATGGEEVEHTLCCIGDRRGTLMGNAWWRGMRLTEVLADLGAEPDADATHLVFTCHDGYRTTIPLADLDGRLMLVWEMNGEPLPEDHGFPVRMLTPGRFGTKNPKWVQGIAFEQEPEVGTWESLGWSDSALIGLRAWFRSPSGGTQVSCEGVVVRGVAFAPRLGLERVELTDDDGATWFPADIVYEGEDDNAWSQWRAEYLPARPGTVTLRVRAIGRDGTAQEDQELTDEALDGWDGWHSLELSFEG